MDGNTEKLMKHSEGNFLKNTDFHLLDIVDAAIQNMTFFNETNMTTDTAMHEGSLTAIISKYLLNLLFGIICIVGLVGNGLVVYVVLRFAKMKTVTNLYIMNLAMADEMFLWSIPFLITTYLMNQWLFGSVMCKVYMIMAVVNQFTSSLFLLVMSSDRYLAVCQPVRSVKWRTPLHAKLVCAFTWTISILVMIPVAMYARAHEYDVAPGVKMTTCTVLWPGGQLIKAEVAFIWYSFLLGFGIPVSLTLVFYCLVLRRLKTLGPKTHRSKEKKKSHRKVTKMVLTVITVYICCWLPYWCLQMVITLGRGGSEPDEVRVWVSLFVYALAYANSAINPILYAFLSDNFRKSFIKAFKCAKTSEGLAAEASVFPARGSRCNVLKNVRNQAGDSEDEEDGETTHVTTAGHNKLPEYEHNAMLLADLKNGKTLSTTEKNPNATHL